MGAIERWSAFLAQIEGRHRMVRDEATRTAQDAIAAVSGIDTTPISRAWSAVESRLQVLEETIIDTWNDKVEQAFDDDGVDHSVRTAAREEGDLLRFTLENTRLELEHRIFADLARQLFARAMASRRGRFCSGCGAALEVPICFRAVDLRCGSCGGVTAFEPGELLRGVAAVGAHALSQEAARAEWLAMRMAERHLHQTRPPRPLPVLKAYERAQIAYWRTYLEARAQLEIELGRDLAMEVRSRMAAWYRSNAEYEEEWVRAGRPCEPIT